MLPMIEDGSLFRAAGWSAWGALLALVISGVTIALFFGGAGDVWGPVNDVFVSITAVLLILPILAVDRIGGGETTPWLRIVSIAAIAGAILIATGQLLLVARVISLETSFVTGGVGVIPVLAWIVAVAVLGLGTAMLPPVVGWLAAVTLVLIVLLSVVAALTLGPATWVTAAALTVAIAAWLGNLAAGLLGRVAA